MGPHGSQPRSYGRLATRVQHLATLALVTFVCGLVPAGARAADDRPVKIVVLGDSLSAGLGLPADAAFPAKLAAALKAKGHDVRGPLSADTLFHAEARARYDAALCMYHDQALIPIKTLSFWDGVNVTLGLPIVRTSPDHGTAFDIAGRGIANAASMIAAIEMAAEIADRREL